MEDLPYSPYNHLASSLKMFKRYITFLLTLFDGVLGYILHTENLLTFFDGVLGYILHTENLLTFFDGVLGYILH